MKTSASVLILLLSVGCSTQSEPSGFEGTMNARTAVSTAASGAPGYIHNFSASRFHIGSGTNSVNELGLQKKVGSDGTFATDPVTGAVRAILNGGSTVATVPALSNNPDVHNARVKTYFSNGGLPADQMGTVQAMAQMEAHGQGGVDTAIPKFLSYTTVIGRAVQGIPVPDSFAAARFNQNDETTMEWVYWPPIPQGVITDALTLQGVLGDSVASAKYFAKLPSELAGQPGQVTIRHSDFADRNFRAFASYDVQDGVRPGRARAGTRSFDLNGTEIIHPNRRPSDVPAASGTAKQ